MDVGQLAADHGLLRFQVEAVRIHVVDFPTLHARTDGQAASVVDGEFQLAEHGETQRLEFTVQPVVQRVREVEAGIEIIALVDGRQLFVELVEIKACEPVCRAVEEAAVLGGQ